ncbi:FAD/NAD(P)-binding domain-containing protein [Daldinia caldariorum]|uniref:FAD/NAD(P)-binding domain-containing protein n=1 Tax=Daldinia caldariorum TaxID=326644 RepID=UPI002008C733|nr:FAD/NAD(P)-binding domain-containing protein [Daldinia caldariorum]KAI1468599.1 FAD/NAD(P)-binding domain-containing protein [Daldinia caldariorum]
MAKDQIQVAIVGGGIAGLALAAGLVKKQHIDVHVYESVPAYKDVGAGLALHLNAIKAMTLLGPEIRQAYFDKALTMGDEDQEMVTEVILGQGPHKGELVAELGRAKGRKTVSRADLLDGFLALIPKDKISFGKKLVEINEQVSGEPKVHLTFQDGSKVEADCLLGADGIHSLTRSYLLGADHPAAPPKNHDGWQIYRTMVPTVEARKQINPKWTTSVPILLGPRGHINCIPLNKNTRLSAGVAVRGAVLSAGGGRAPPLDPAWYADYTEDAQRIVRMVAADTSASWTAADHDHAPYYARGRVAMFGDAAHASMPFAGNGAAQALEDAAVLDCLLARVRRTDELLQVEHALLAFDRVRRPRSQAVVDLARKFGRVYAYAEDGMHEDPERMKRFFGEMAAFTNEFDVKGQNEAALKVFEELELGMEMDDGVEVNGNGKVGGVVES